jgi:hypothetical protein
MFIIRKQSRINKGGDVMSDLPLVWVKDNAGNRFLCPMDALRVPNSVSEKEKMN